MGKKEKAPNLFYFPHLTRRKTPLLSAHRPTSPVTPAARRRIDSPPPPRLGRRPHPVHHSRYAGPRFQPGTTASCSRRWGAGPTEGGYDTTTRRDGPLPFSLSLSPRLYLSSRTASSRLTTPSASRKALSPSCLMEAGRGYGPVALRPACRGPVTGAAEDVATTTSSQTASAGTGGGGAGRRWWEWPGPHVMDAYLTLREMLRHRAWVTDGKCVPPGLRGPHANAIDNPLLQLRWGRAHLHPFLMPC